MLTKLAIEPIKFRLYELKPELIDNRKIKWQENLDLHLAE